MEEVASELLRAEIGCSELEKRIQQAGKRKSDSNSDLATELSSLQIENSKLQYRIGILKRSLKEDGHSLPEVMAENSNLESFLHTLKNAFETAISSAFPNVRNPPISISPCSVKCADYQCNSAMQIVKRLRDDNTLQDGVKANPKDIAETIVRHVPKIDMISNIEVSAPGFINVTIDSKYLCKKVRDILVNGISVANPKRSCKVIVDYSSPNIAKQMHVGHLRSTIIGDCLANVFEFLGDEVVRVNHVGDWGTQFGMLLAQLVERYPDFADNPPPISDLQAFYKEAKARFDSEEEFKARAYACVVQLQAKEPKMYTAWKQICDVSRKEFEKVYNALGIMDLREKGESFYHDLMNAVVEDLESRGLIEESEGRKILYTPKCNGHLLIVKSDGGFTYDTSDMACLKYRVQVEKADRIVYVVDAGQESHFKTLFEGGKIAGYYDPEKVQLCHVGFGVVLGDDKKKFKTRSGETVKLMDLIDEGLERALKKLQDKGRDKVLTPEELKAAQEAVAIGCIKYADLSHDLTLDYQFSFDRMLDDRGNTAVYLLYSLTRIRSIIRTANITTPLRDLAEEKSSLNLEHPRELRLAKYLLKFPEIIIQVSETLYPHTLCSYLFELSVVFSEFYEQCYCVEKIRTKDKEETKVNIDRVLLCEAAASVMDTGLRILGIKSVSKM